MGPTRVTHRWRMMRDISRIRSIGSSISSLQEQAYSGKKVIRASDAPSDWVGIENLRSAQTDQGTYAQSADRAYTVLSAIDRTLQSASDVFKRVRELAVGAASEVASNEYTQAAALEVESLREQLLGYANQKHAGRALFAGTAYDGAAFDATGTYVGSNDEPTVRISEGDYVVNGFDGATVFSGPTDVFQVLADLKTALDAGDSDEVHNLLGAIDESHTQLVTARSRVGVYERRTEDLQLVAAELESTLAELVSNRVDADPIAIYTQLASMKTTYEATLQIASGTFATGLFSYL